MGIHWVQSLLVARLVGILSDLKLVDTMRRIRYVRLTPSDNPSSLARLFWVKVGRRICVIRLMRLVAAAPHPA